MAPPVRERMARVRGPTVDRTEVHGSRATFDPRAFDGPVVLVAGNAWDGLGSSDRHLARHLAAHVPVLYVDPPMRWWSTIPSGPTVVHPGVLRITPRVPPAMYRTGLHHLLHHLVAHAVNDTLDALRTHSSAVVVACPSPILSVLPATRRVLYATDDWVAGAQLMGVPSARTTRVQVQQAATADLVIAVSDVLADQYRARGHHHVVVIPNGCDLDTLADVDEQPLPDDVQLPHPITGLLGHLSDRVSLDHLEAVADRRLSLMLVGPRQDHFGGARFDDLVRRSNVCWVGERHYEQMPSYLRLIDAGLTPYRSSPFNQASSPLKTIEYLAAGRGSVSTNLSGIRAFHNDEVTIADAPQDFADAVERTLAGPRTRGLMETRRASVAQHDWALRAEEVLAALDLPLRTGPRRPR
jgi:teichuronic acid biosynthesis glycosyltransferase TuaH